MGKTEKKQIDDIEAVKNLLIINLLKDGVDPKLIELATGIAEKTIRNKFPMSKIRGNQIGKESISRFNQCIKING